MKKAGNFIFIAILAIVGYGSAMGSGALEAIPTETVQAMGFGMIGLIGLGFMGLKMEAGTLNASALVIDQVTSTFTKYYKPNGTEEQAIKDELRHVDDIGQDFNRKLVTAKYYESVLLETSVVLQGFYKDFVAKGKGTLKPYRHEIGEYKIDRDMDPDDYESGWTSFLASMTEVDRAKWPMIAWMIRKVLLPRASEDYLLLAAYWGWKWDGTFNSSPTVNGTTFQRQMTSASNPIMANASVDGFHTQMAKMISAGRLTPITMGAVPTDPKLFVDYVESFVSQIDAPLRRRIDKLYMNDTLAKRFKTGMNTKYNTYYGAEDITKVWDENIEIVGTVSMTGSDQIWGTIPENRSYIVRSDKGGRFAVQPDKRTVNIFTDYQHAHILEVPEFVVTTDQDTGITAGMITSYYTEGSGS